MDSQSSGGTKNVWKPTVGTHTIRMVPYLYNKDWPFIELYFYYKLKKGTVLSPISFGKPDPVQEFVEKLKSTGDKEDWKTAINMQAKQRVYIPILVRGKEEEGVKFWGFGKQIYQELLKIVDDPDYGDISHLKTGRDIVVEITQQTGKSWPDISIRMKPNSSEVSKDRSVLDLLKEMPDITTLWKEPSYEELKVMLERYLDNIDDTIEPASTSTPTADADDDPFSESNAVNFEDFVPEGPAKATTSSKKAAPKNPTPLESVDTEFDDLFNS